MISQRLYCHLRAELGLEPKTPGSVSSHRPFAGKSLLPWKLEEFIPLNIHAG